MWLSGYLTALHAYCCLFLPITNNKQSEGYHLRWREGTPVHQNIVVILVGVLALIFVCFATKAPADTKEADTKDMELVMFVSSNCTYCKLFDRDVGDDYAKSWPGRIAPLNRIKISSDYRKYKLSTQIVTVPTFILFNKNNELGRITGYPGRNNFFQLIVSLLKPYR